ncbi:MAG: hypothetical protein HKN76_20555 [Saprospiraceae bacterium]|nr:hypothetical protein [Saprospiraceae bacterium]
MMKPILLIVMLGYFASTVNAQIRDSLPSGLLLSAHYGWGTPGKDLANRFGTHFMLGGSVAFLSKRDLYFSLDYSLVFGNKVKEDVLSNLRTVEGGIIGRDMQFASIFLRERAHLWSANGGYFFRLAQRHSGFLLSGGLGYLQHKIRIVDDFDSVVQVSGPYRKGYDRLSGGLSLIQSLTYLYLSKDKLINFYINLQLVEAFTKDLRGVNYNQSPLISDRTDLLASIKVGWVMPIYFEKEIRYY